MSRCKPTRRRGSDSQPKRLKTLAFNVKYSGGNNLLHQFVLDNSDPNNSASANYITSVLRMMPDTSVNSRNDDGYSALHLAVLSNNLSMVKSLLSCFVNIDVNTALYLASLYEHLSIVQELLNKGASVNITNGYEKVSALSCVARDGNLEILKLLLDNGADVNQRDVYGKSPLHCAAKEGNSAIVELLLINGANVNARDENNDTPLHMAADQSHVADEGHVEVIRVLLNKDADESARNNHGKTPLDLAKDGKYQPCIDALQKVPFL